MGITGILTLIGIGAVAVLGVLLFFKSRTTSVVIDKGKKAVILSKEEREKRQKVIDDLQKETDEFEEVSRKEISRINDLKRISSKHKDTIVSLEFEIEAKRSFIEDKKKELGLV